jgi:hypothetical protein
LVERNPSSPKKPQSESYRREKETHRESPRAHRQRSTAVSGRAVPLDPTGIGMPRRRSKNMGSGGACLHHGRKGKAPFGGREHCRRPLPWRVAGVASTETTGRGRNRQRKGAGSPRHRTAADREKKEKGRWGRASPSRHGRRRRKDSGRRRRALSSRHRGHRDREGRPGEHSTTPLWGGSGAGDAPAARQPGSATSSNRRHGRAGQRVGETVARVCQGWLLGLVLIQLCARSTVGSHPMVRGERRLMGGPWAASIWAARGSGSQ